MTAFTIIGKGNMGNTIGGLLAEGGNNVDYVVKGGTSTIAGDVVIIATPHPAVADIVATYGDQLAGKIVVDITNPLNFETFDSLVVPAGSSSAATLAEALPQSKVLKAFNTNFAATLATKKVGDNTTTVLVAGDDAEAKQTLIDAVVAGGIAAIDAGALSRAHELEAIGFLQLTLAARETIGWTGGFALVK